MRLKSLEMLPIHNYQQPAPKQSQILTAPLSYTQQRLWFLQQLEPGLCSYHINVVLDLHGPLVPEYLESSFNEILRRHEILRTTFASIDSTPLQFIHPFQPVSIPTRDLRSVQADSRLESAKKRICEGIYQPFDLACFPVFRTGLIRLQEDRHLFYLIIHHMLFDGWSRNIFIKEFCELYRSCQAGVAPNLPALPIQYRDYAAREREKIQNGGLKTDLKFWIETLAKPLPVLDLPVDKPRPPVQTYRGAEVNITLPQPLISGLEMLSRQNRTTLFMTMLAAFKILLTRYTGQSDIIAGVPVAGRTHLDFDGLIGMFVNDIALRTKICGDPTFLELLNQVRSACLNGYAHMEVPFDLLVSELNPERDLSRTPVFQVFFNMLNFGEMTTHAGELNVELLDLELELSKFDLSVVSKRLKENPEITFEYNTDLFDRETIVQFAAHYQNLLTNILAEPENRISEFVFMSETEIDRILKSWNQTSAVSNARSSISGMWKQQAARSADSPALISDGKIISYRALDQQVDQLAFFLAGQGIQPEAKVGLLIERSVEMVIAMLAVIRAGGVYVPLDPGYPLERLAGMLADSGANFLLTKKRHLANIPQPPVRTLYLDEGWENFVGDGTGELPMGANPENAAYFIYTSGSTGVPKGVPGMHAGLLNRLNWMWQAYPFEPGEVCCQKTSLSMVDSVCEILSPLLQGIPLVLLSDEDVRSPQRFVAILAEHQVFRLVLVPSLLALLLEAVPNLGARLPVLRLCISSGETLPLELARKFQACAPNCTLLNLYGSSEVSADVAYHPIQPEDLETGPIPIGKPISNTQIYLLDRFLQPVPIGVKGEIFIGGANLARGYHQKSELTAERFLPDPFSTEPGQRLYRTGDMGRFRRDGTIEYLGRTDDQVKLRGFRIELNEIRTLLEQHPGIRQAVVVLRADLPAGKGLAAYFIPADENPPSAQELRSWLEKRLPAYMLPAAWVCMRTFPLTPSGKLDVLRMPEPQMNGNEAETLTAPRDDLERRLVKIWEGVLAVKPIGIKDDFFQLGGHSLLDIRVVDQIEHQIGIRLPLLTILKAPTIEKLAQAIRAGGISENRSSVVPLQPDGSKPPLFLVHGLGGGVLDYLPLVEQLGAGQPVYGLVARGLLSGEMPDQSIEDMAARCVRAIKSIQPAGPYYLGGYCFGGVVAYEAACQLLENGDSVSFLGIIEGYTLDYFQRSIDWTNPKHFWGFFQNLPYWLNDALHRKDAIRYLFNRLKKEIGRKSGRAISAAEIELNLELFLGNERAVSERYHAIMEVHLVALHRYHPQPYSGGMTLFRVKAQSLFHPNDPLLGWEHLVSGGIGLRIVRGAHYNLHLPPYVGSLGASMRECLLDSRKF